MAGARPRVSISLWSSLMLKSLVLHHRRRVVPTHNLSATNTSRIQNQTPTSTTTRAHALEYGRAYHSYFLFFIYPIPKGKLEEMDP